jgi:hypothetical protein
MAVYTVRVIYNSYGFVSSPVIKYAYSERVQCTLLLRREYICHSTGNINLGFNRERLQRHLHAIPAHVILADQASDGPAIVDSTSLSDTILRRTVSS